MKPNSVKPRAEGGPRCQAEPVTSRELPAANGERGVPAGTGLTGSLAKRSDPGLNLHPGTPHRVKAAGQTSGLWQGTGASVAGAPTLGQGRQQPEPPPLGQTPALHIVLHPALSLLLQVRPSEHSDFWRGSPRVLPEAVALETLPGSCWPPPSLSCGGVTAAITASHAAPAAGTVASPGGHPGCPEQPTDLLPHTGAPAQPLIQLHGHCPQGQSHSAPTDYPVDSRWSAGPPAPSPGKKPSV